MKRLYVFFCTKLINFAYINDHKMRYSAVEDFIHTGIQTQITTDVQTHRFFHKAPFLLCLGVSYSGSDRSATIASRLFGSDFVFYLIASSQMTSADISFTGKTDIRLSADEMFLSRIADGVVILAFTWFKTSIQRVG